MLQTNPIPENLIARGIVDVSYRVHSKLGPGLLESVYESALAYELGARGMTVVRQKPIRIVSTDMTLVKGSE